MRRDQIKELFQTPMGVKVIALYFILNGLANLASSLPYTLTKGNDLITFPQEVILLEYF